MTKHPMTNPERMAWIEKRGQVLTFNFWMTVLARLRYQAQKLKFKTGSQQLIYAQRFLP